MKRIILSITLTLVVIFTASAKDFNLSYNAEANIICGGRDYTPFWMMNNTHGVVSDRNNSGYLRLGLFKEVAKDKKFSYSFGLEVVGAYRNEAPVYLQQAYFDAKLKNWSIFAGAREEKTMLWDEELSSGGMVHSGNARPIPQIYIGLPQFTQVPGTKGWFHVRGGLSYGWFVDYPYQKDFKTDGMQYTKNLLYHRKNLVFKIGNKSKPLYGLIGIDMATQFGGTVYDYKGSKTIKFPSGIKEYFKVLIPLSGGEDSPTVDQVNVSGNHLGIYILALGYKKKDWEIKAYYEHFFDDHSGMTFRNKFDGLWGLSYRSTKQFFVEGVTLEVMNATNQSGPFLWDETSEIPVQVSAGDNYYAHVVYNGWTHRGHTMGTPFITSPLYNKDGYLGFTNNITRAFYGGVDGTIVDGLRYKLLVSHQRGWGTSYAPYTNIKHQFATMLQLNYTHEKVKGWNFSLAGAFDKRNLFGDNWGVQIGVSKSGELLNLSKK